MKRALLVLCTIAAALAGASHASAGTTYYVSPSGNDGAAGDASHPWRTVGHVDKATLQPGDTVLFQGGATFADATLMPAQSGTASAPITFGSFGTGKANLSGGIWFSQKSNLTFDGLAVDDGSSPGDLSAIQASASGSGSTAITIEHCAFTHVRIGVNSANTGDAGWKIDDTLIQYTRDSGAIVIGHDFTFSGNTILDTGQDASIAYGKHGVYAKGPGLTFVDNTIRRFSDDGISLRYHDATVVGNTISDGPIGVAWFQVDPGSGGTTTIAYNRITGTTSSGIYVSPSDAGGTTRESFVIADNTVKGASGNASDLSRTGGSLTLANNVFTGAVSPTVRVYLPGGAYTEHNDAFSSTSAAPQIVLGSSWLGLAAYASASGQGSGDTTAAPDLDADLAPASGSPLVDAGSSSVRGASYTTGCDGAAWHYCGSAPDMGAVESTTGAPIAAPTAVLATATQSSVTLTWTAAADPRVTSYSVSRNGAAAVTTSTTSATISGLDCGVTSTFDVRSVTATGTASDPTTVSASTTACPPKDTTRPWVLITSPTGGQTVATHTTVHVDATDASGIGNVTFWVDGTQTCVDSTAPYTCATTLANGPHTLLVRATDGAGNIAWMSVKVTASSSVRTTSSATSGAARKATLARSTAARTRSFVLALRRPAGARTVTFLLDGRPVCTRRTAPYRCVAAAGPGWHRMTVLSHAVRLSSHFRVA